MITPQPDHVTLKEQRPEPPASARRWVVVVDASLSAGVAANTAAVLALTLGATAPELLGPETKDRDGQLYPGLTTLALPILTAAETLPALVEAARSADVLAAVMTHPAQGRTTYTQYTDEIARTSTSELRVAGAGLLGPARVVNRLTGSLPLLR